MNEIKIYMLLCYGPYKKLGSKCYPVSINTDRTVLMQLTFVLTAISKLGPYQNYQLQQNKRSC